MKKKISAVYMVLVSVAAFGADTAGKILTDGDYTYTRANQSAVIVRYVGNAPECVIPDALGGLEVSEVGDFAFGGKSVKSVTIPASVVTIGARAFQDCDQLTKVAFAGNAGKLQSIYGAAFSGTRIPAIDLPGGVEFVGSGAFKKCSELKKVIFRGDAPETTGELFDAATPSDLVVKVSKESLGWKGEGVAGLPETWQNRAVAYITADDEPKPTTPDEPVNPPPVDPTPSDPVDPTPTDPNPPVDPTPSDPVDPTPTDPNPPVKSDSLLDTVAWASSFTDGDANKLKRTYEGFVLNGDSVAGLVTLTITGKASNPKLVAKVALSSGNLTFKSTKWERMDDGAYKTALTVKNRVMELEIGDGTALGKFDGQDVCLARNLAIDKAGQAAIAPYVGDYTAAIAGEQVDGYLQLTVKAAKGAVTVKGALADGTAITAKSTLLDFGVGKACVPVFAMKKNKYTLSALLWISTADGVIADDSVYGARWNSEALAIDGARFAKGAVDGARVISIVGSLPQYFDKKYGWVDAIETASPDGMEVTVAKGKVALAQKATMPKKQNGVYVYAGPTDSGLKLSYKVATGLLSGSFKLYYDWPSGNKTMHKAVMAKVKGIARGSGFVGFVSVPQSNPELKKKQKLITFMLEIHSAVQEAL